MGGSFFAWFLKGECFWKLGWNMLKFGLPPSSTQKCRLGGGESTWPFPEMLSFQLSKVAENPPGHRWSRHGKKWDRWQDNDLRSCPANRQFERFRSILQICSFLFRGGSYVHTLETHHSKQLPKGFPTLFFVDIQKLSAEKFRVSPICFFPGKYGNFFTEPWLWKKESWKIPPFSACLRYLGIVLGEICLIHQDPKMLDGDCFCMFLSGGFSLFRSIRAVHVAVWPLTIFFQCPRPTFNLPKYFCPTIRVPKTRGCVFFWGRKKIQAAFCNDVILPIIFLINFLLSNVYPIQTSCTSRMM